MLAVVLVPPVCYALVVDGRLRVQLWTSKPVPEKEGDDWVLAGVNMGWKGSSLLLGVLSAAQELDNCFLSSSAKDSTEASAEFGSAMEVMVSVAAGMAVQVYVDRNLVDTPPG